MTIKTLFADSVSKSIYVFRIFAIHYISSRFNPNFRVKSRQRNLNRVFGEKTLKFLCLKFFCNIRCCRGCYRYICYATLHSHRIKTFPFENKTENEQIVLAVHDSLLCSQPYTINPELATKKFKHRYTWNIRRVFDWNVNITQTLTKF